MLFGQENTSQMLIYHCSLHYSAARRSVTSIWLVF